MVWKLEDLVAEADAFEVARSLGIRMKKAGATTYIESPDGRKESGINHVQLFHDGCYDYSMGIGRNTYGMVRDWLQNVAGQNATHDDICTAIAQTCGGPERFLVKKGKKDNAVQFPLTQEELEAIGLAPISYNEDVEVFSFDRDSLCTKRMDDGWALMKRTPSASIRKFFAEDAETALWLMQSKAVEAMRQCHANAKWVKADMADDASPLRKGFEEEVNAKHALALSAKKKATALLQQMQRKAA